MPARYRCVYRASRDWLRTDGRTLADLVFWGTAGNAATAMGGGAANGVPQADGTIKPEATFDVQEVGRAIVYMASLPLGANVFNMTLM